MDYAAIPPDVTSALMYMGAGAGPLMAAATAYNNLAAEASSAATQWQSIMTTLTSEVWTGAGSMAAAASAESIVSWLTTTAASLEHAGVQATASAAAYEAAFAGVIPPPVIAENRARLLALQATNFLGINTPAIMATEAQYEAMWVQDATTMYVYDATSSSTGVLQPISPETQSTNPGAPGIQAAANAKAATSPATQGLSNGLSGITNQLLGSSSGSDPSLIDWSNIPIVQNVIYNVGVTAAWNVAMLTATFPLLGHFLASSPLGVTPFIDDVTPLGAGLGMGTTLVGSTGFGGAAATAAMGEASAVGGLSVPASWSAAAPATLASSTAPLEGSGWTVAAEEGGPVAAMPGMPGMAAGKGAGAYAAPRYGVKPIVMPKHVVV
jgi:PPE-repeat protein